MTGKPKKGSPVGAGFRHIGTAKREELFRMIFGPWSERAELNEIVFPDSRNPQDAPDFRQNETNAAKAKRIARRKTSSMSQFMTGGKSSDDIEAALKILLFLNPMAGAPDMSAIDRDRAGKDEFASDIMVFMKNAAKYQKRHSPSAACRTIIVAASAIKALSDNQRSQTDESDETREAMSALWYGIAALLEDVDRLPFSLLREISKPIHAAASASSRHCKDEIGLFRESVGRHTASLWQHAVLGQAEARESFSILGDLTGRRLPAEFAEAFCALLPKRGPKRRVGFTHCKPPKSGKTLK